MATKARYLHLAGHEAHDKSLTASERIKIFYWFHARGWPIDEGCHEAFIGKRKRLRGDLLSHWTGSNSW